MTYALKKMNLCIIIQTYIFRIKHLLHGNINLAQIKSAPDLSVRTCTYMIFKNEKYLCEKMLSTYHLQCVSIDRAVPNPAATLQQASSNLSLCCVFNRSWYWGERRWETMKLILPCSLSFTDNSLVMFPSSMSRCFWFFDDLRHEKNKYTNNTHSIWVRVDYVGERVTGWWRVRDCDVRLKRQRLRQSKSPNRSRGMLSYQKTFRMSPWLSSSVILLLLSELSLSDKYL